MKNTKKNNEKWLEKVKNTLELGGKSHNTYINYENQLKHFFKYYEEDVNIDKLKEENITNYLKKEYIDKNKAGSTVNLAVCSIRFLYSICFSKELNKRLLPNVKLTKKLPTIISKSDFLKLVNGEKSLKYKCWLLLAFCSGLRVAEVATIRIENIYPNDHKLKVLGKGNKERFTFLPDITIKFLRLYCKEQRITKKQGYLFKGVVDECVNSKSIINHFSTLKCTYNLNNNLSFHSLRHSFATYYLMNGGNIITLKSMLGHTSLSTTGIYIHIAQNFNQLEGVRYV